MPYKDPGRQREYKLRWQEENRERQREANRRWYQNNRERDLENSRRWAKENPDRVRLRCRIKQHRRRTQKNQTTGFFTAEQFAVLCAHFKQHCLKCGRPRKLTPDHVIPLAWADRPEFAGVSLGDIDNIQPLCNPCNSGKSATHVDYRTKPHRNCINPPEVEDYLV